jgi:hypothetical protein
VRFGHALRETRVRLEVSFMNAVPLKVKIGEARQRVSTAERELEEQMKVLSAANGGEKTIVAQLLENAFSALRDAKKELVELTELLDNAIVIG